MSAASQKDFVSRVPWVCIPERWQLCAPLLVVRQGTRRYLGSAVFTFRSRVQVLRPLYEGDPSESYSDVLGKTKAIMDQMPAPKIIERKLNKVVAPGSNRV